jgi:two-component system sporulation sensor kinase B
MNLTKNAIEATSSGGKVTIEIYIRDGRVYIIIADTGKGMSREQLQRLGTLFYSTRDAGTGPGTAVSWQIIRNMNGSIHYESELNVGTEVTIALPSKS